MPAPKRKRSRAKKTIGPGMRRRGPIMGGALPAPGNVAVGVGRVLGGIFTRKAALPRMAGTPRAATRAPAAPKPPTPRSPGPGWETRPASRPTQAAWIGRQAKDLTNRSGVRSGGGAAALPGMRSGTVKRVAPRDTSPKPTVVRAAQLKRRPSQRASFR
jgi:hypothetical protein